MDDCDHDAMGLGLTPPAGHWEATVLNSESPDRRLFELTFILPPELFPLTRTTFASTTWSMPGSHR